MAKLSIIVWTHETDEIFYRWCLESINNQDYVDWELNILDENYGERVFKMTDEFFPGDIRVRYKKLKNSKGGAYAYNIGTRFATGKYYLFLDQHDCIRDYSTLTTLIEKIEENDDRNRIFYTDSTEMHGIKEEPDINPHYKNAFNKELLLRTPYMGDFVCIGEEAFKRIGEFNEKLNSAYIYDFLLRGLNNKDVKYVHIPGLYHRKRVIEDVSAKERKKRNNKQFREAMTVAKAYFIRNNIKAKVTEDPRGVFWRVEYDGREYRKKSNDYIVLRSPDVKVMTRHALEKLYGYLTIPDIAVVGVRFINGAFSIDNVGFIHDNNAIIYSAFHNQKMFLNGYENLDVIPRDVSLVDEGFCILNAKYYRKLGGLDNRLCPREALLDYCMRAREHGLRTVVEPMVIARHKNKKVISSSDSHDAFMEKHKELIWLGDPYYNPNLPLGMENNYKLEYEADIVVKPTLENLE